MYKLVLLRADGKLCSPSPFGRQFIWTPKARTEPGPASTCIEQKNIDLLRAGLLCSGSGHPPYVGSVYSGAFHGFTQFRHARHALQVLRKTKFWTLWDGRYRAVLIYRFRVHGFHYSGQIRNFPDLDDKPGSVAFDLTMPRGHELGMTLHDNKIHRGISLAWFKAQPLPS